VKAQLKKCLFAARRSHFEQSGLLALENSLPTATLRAAGKFVSHISVKYDGVTQIAG
jgi:hypothetical protein